MTQENWTIITDMDTRTEIAKDILCAMLQGAYGTEVLPGELEAFRNGVMASPAFAVTLADKLIEELGKVKQ